MSMKPGARLRNLTKMVLVVLVLTWGSAVEATGQEVAVNINVDPASTRVAIEGTCAPTTVWSFQNTYANLIGLGNRIEKFALNDELGQKVAVRKIAPGQFESSKPAARFHYEVNLAPPALPSDSAMVSWLNNDRGLLMLADLLPIAAQKEHTSAKIKLTLPQTWRAYSSGEQPGQAEFSVHDVDRAVVAVGAHLRASTVNESGMTLRFITDGDWAFSDPEALELIGKVLKAHHEIFNAVPSKRGQLILFPFPQTTGATNWSAETRDANVTLLLGKLPTKVGALAQLSTPLTHELFHLWIPNGLALSGDYDWFYEGFTVYEASRVAVDLGLLTFPEFLNSIARAYDASLQDGSLSLLEASRTRFTTGKTSVYARSQLLAFVYDLRLRTLSHRKRSLSDIYRKLFQANADRSDVDGNDAVISVLSRELGSQEFVDSHVRRPFSIDLGEELAPFGLKVEKLGLRTHIGASDKLSRQQRDLLRDLGYNDATHGTRRK